MLTEYGYWLETNISLYEKYVWFYQDERNLPLSESDWRMAIECSTIRAAVDIEISGFHLSHTVDMTADQVSG